MQAQARSDEKGEAWGWLAGFPRLLPPRATLPPRAVALLPGASTKRVPSDNR